MQSFPDLLMRFPSLADIARELEVPHDTVISWKRRRSVPYEYWPALCESASRHKIRGVTMKQLAQAADGVRLQRRNDRLALKAQKRGKPQRKQPQRDRQAAHAPAV